MHLLFETAAGFALFQVKGGEKFVEEAKVSARPPSPPPTPPTAHPLSDAARAPPPPAYRRPPPLPCGSGLRPSPSA